MSLLLMLATDYPPIQVRDLSPQGMVNTIKHLNSMEEWSIPGPWACRHALIDWIRVKASPAIMLQTCVNNTFDVLSSQSIDLYEIIDSIHPNYRCSNQWGFHDVAYTIYISSNAGDITNCYYCSSTIKSDVFKFQVGW